MLPSGFIERAGYFLPESDCRDFDRGLRASVNRDRIWAIVLVAAEFETRSGDSALVIVRPGRSRVELEFVVFQKNAQ